MIDSLDIAVASRNEVQTHIAVADGDRRCRTALGGRFQPEHGLVELAERVVLVADDGHVIDLGEHRNYPNGRQNLPCCGGLTILSGNLPPTPPQRPDLHESFEPDWFRFLPPPALASAPAG